MIQNKIETLRAGKVLPDHCACGHLKDSHLRNPDDEFLRCQEMVYNAMARKMMQCGCKI